MCSYSTPRVDFIGISCYSSKDLLNWRFEGGHWIQTKLNVQGWVAVCVIQLDDLACHMRAESCSSRGRADQWSVLSAYDELGSAEDSNFHVWPSAMLTLSLPGC